MTAQIVLLVILLAGSAFFSGSETALFSLTAQQRQQFAASNLRLQRWAAALIRQPDRLLVTLLLGNMAINVSFFATGTLLALRIAQDHPGWQTALAGIAPLLAIIVVGEVIPKVAAISRPEPIATLVAGPIWVLTFALTPLRVVLERAFVRPAVRLLAPEAQRDDGPVTPEQLQELFESSAQRGTIDLQTRDLLREVVELRVIKVHEVMVPRVDIVAFNLAQPREALLDLLRRSHLKRIPVYRGDLDHVVGIVHARDVVLHPDRAVSTMVRPVGFVPELATLESLLTQFRSRGTQLMIAVDEHGGVAGLVTSEDVVEEIVGELYDPADNPEEPIKSIRPDEYLIRGDFSIRDWSALFGPHPSTDRTDTLGGLVTARLGRVPTPGDTVRIRNLKLTVESMHRRRIGWIRLHRLDEEPTGSTETEAKT